MYRKSKEKDVSHFFWMCSKFKQCQINLDSEVYSDYNLGKYTQIVKINHIAQHYVSFEDHGSLYVSKRFRCLQSFPSEVEQELTH